MTQNAARDYRLECGAALRVFAIALFTPFAITGSANADEPIGFNRDIRPILAAHCFKCHGPDDQTREANLRFDRRDSATAPVESGATPIAPGKPAESDLVKRILAADDSQMPPAAANKPLSDAQKQLLQAWIAQGAPYETHWAFTPPRQAPAAAVALAQWPRNPIDNFVLARLEAEKLAPSPEADKYTLARRLYLDLIGLPPTPAEVDVFVYDSSPQAYEALVDRLLASPHYGERWARRWLDLARYADTNGYEKDRPRSIWPYRDWVIDSLNADLPFDQFTIAQLAGDLLPDATPAQRIATGFHRNTMLNEEGGIDPLEFRYYAMVDRVSTTSTVWLGLTLGCAQCHTHKYDPITHADYYQFMAFLNNADEPTIDVEKPEIAAERARLAAEAKAIEDDLSNRFPTEGEFHWSDPTSASVVTASGAVVESLEDHSFRVSGAETETDTYTLTFESELPQVAALQLEALTDPQLPKQGPGRTPHGNFVVTEFSASLAPLDKPEAAQPLALATASADFAQAGFPPERMLDGDQKTGWAIHGPDPWNVPRTAVFRLAAPAVNAGRSRWTIRLDHQYGGRHTLGRFRIRLGEPLATDRPESERRKENLERKYREWLAAESASAVRWTPLRVVSAASDIPTLSLEPENSIFVTGDMSKRDIYRVAVAADLPRITAIRLEVLPDDRLPERGPGRISYEGPFGDFFLSEFTARTGEQPLKFAAATHSFASGGNTAAVAIDGDPQTGWSISGGQGRAHTAVFRLAEPAEVKTPFDIQLLFERYYAAGLGRFRLWATDDTRLVTARDLPTEIEAILLKAEWERTAAEQAKLLAQFLAVAPELASPREAIRKLREQMPAYPTTLVMRERPAHHPRTTHIHKRGEFLQTTTEVSAELPSLFAPLGANEPHDRLRFARWLASEQNPLVARVTVNRQWAAFFGRGIVRTTEDFGYQGDPPTHPDLLDWLAVEFMRQGWSVKQLQKLIVTSATYRQTSTVMPDRLERDPQNKLLSRSPRVRLDAELVRDAALRISGMLTEKIGGPSVYPPQPAGVTSEGTYGPLSWQVSEGADRYRRGLYTFAKRTAPYAMFLTFDAASGEACLARREVSNTPLQALTLLNDTVFVEAAQALGKRLAQQSGGDEARLDVLFRSCVGRLPTAAERSLLLSFHRANEARLNQHALDATQIASAGDPQNQLARAAWTLTARAVLNLDETITRE